MEVFEKTCAYLYILYAIPPFFLLITMRGKIRLFFLICHIKNYGTFIDIFLLIPHN